MNYRILFFTLFIGYIPANIINCKVETDAQIKNVLEKKLNTRSKKKNTKKIHFFYTDAALVDVINELAAEKNVNIMLPQASDITQKITYHYPDLITVDEAWNLLIKLLDAIGYTIVPSANMISIVKNDSTVIRQSLPFYHTNDLSELPDSEEIIRYLYYFNNIALGTGTVESTIQTILKDLLSTGAYIKTDSKTNSVLITDRSSYIKSVMKILIELDQGGVRDAVEVMPMIYTNATTIAGVFTTLLQTSASTNAQEPPKNSYFPPNTRIVSLERSNSLVIMGTTKAIDLMKDFIVKYLDVPLESGNSILHAYDLQYLKATTFAPVLQNIVANQTAAGSQTTGEATGPKKYFKDVIVQPEVQRVATSAEGIIKPTQLTSQASAPLVNAAVQPLTIGGNRIIVAATTEDWIRIKKLIEQLDKPQPQVALEVLVIDLRLENDRTLGSQMRDKTGLNNSISPNIHFQSAQLEAPVLTGCTTPVSASALMSNLLELCGDPATNFAKGARPGSLIVSFKDPQDNGIWLLWQILDAYVQANILAQPFIVTKNHQQGTVRVEQVQYLRDVAKGTAATVSIDYLSIPAGIVIDLLPHINHERNNINLEIAININDFLDNVGTRSTRVFQTNASIGNGQVLVLGGLIRKSEVERFSTVPVLGQIPLIGWFWKKKTVVKERNDLLVLISPTIIEPYKDGISDTFTKNKFDMARENSIGKTFDELRDPINRWFFEPQGFRNIDLIDDYVERMGKYEEHAKEHAARVAKLQMSQEDSMKDQLKALTKDEENPLLVQSSETSKVAQAA
jgi:general secretion pathway protein D